MVKIMKKLLSKFFSYFFSPKCVSCNTRLKQILPNRYDVEVQKKKTRIHNSLFYNYCPYCEQRYKLKIIRMLDNKNIRYEIL